MLRARRAVSLSDVVRFCKEQGFVYPSSEVHGGFSNSYDYGPLGSTLKKKLLDSWWRRFVTQEPQCFALDSAVMLPPVVWERSGHLDNFTDPLVDCKRCKKRFRADHLAGFDAARPGALRDAACPCGKANPWGESASDVRDFNLMFETSVGAVAGDGTAAYLRPETAQGAYLNFSNVQKSTRAQVPFGVAQSGKAFRNEVTPGQFTFRTREFEQLEMQWFCAGGDADAWFEHWLAEGREWLVHGAGLRESSLRLAEHAEADLAHYALRTTDVEFEYPFGWGELWGFANRGTHDLSSHGLEYRGNSDKSAWVPTVVEPALGLTRLVLAVLCDALHHEVDDSSSSSSSSSSEPPLPLIDNNNNNNNNNNDDDSNTTARKKKKKEAPRVVLRLKAELAPCSVAVLPLHGTSAAHVDLSQDIAARLRREQPWLDVAVQAGGNRIGKRYRRQDAMGTPFCVTCDLETAADGCVTVRERDSASQVRIPIDDVVRCGLPQLQALFPPIELH